MTPTDRARVAILRTAAAIEAATAPLYSRLRRLEERTEWERRHLRPETPHERERRERGL